MSFDFTLTIFKKLLVSFKQNGYAFQTFEDYVRNPGTRVIVLRHDVDRIPQNSLTTARIEHDHGIRGTYFFRAVPQSWNEDIIRSIYESGHEIGYHYEDFVFASRKSKAIRQKQVHEYEGGLERDLANFAFESFAHNLVELRKIAPVKTICMHGNPLSRWDSRLIWKYYDYKDLGIISEPYLDLNFEHMLYLTDTGRRWNGQAVSMRDKASGFVSKVNESGQKASDLVQKLIDSYNNWVVKPVKGSLMNMTEKSIDLQKRYNFQSTKEIIRELNHNRFPDKSMITYHPQRWSDNPLPWLKELILQNAKNVIKFYLVNTKF